MKVVPFSAVLFLVVLLLVSVSGKDYCGTGDYTEDTSATIRFLCPERFNPINNCCRRHDHCYDVQAGKERCDDKFCRCLERAVRSKWLCYGTTVGMCAAVKEFGDWAYEKAGKN
uniref:Secretory peptide n=1 Tax=Steinernema glaseri TaxID=37863 RepID=A0A1I7ZIH9_9BILA